MIAKLVQKYHLDMDKAEFIAAMYTDTHSATQHNHSISPIVQTDKGVQQGAVSSPILFNLFIDDLLAELNQHATGNKCANIGDIKINNLGYADDLALFAKDEEGLRELIIICEDWAKKWGLNFSADKSKILTTNNTVINPNKPIQMDGVTIKQTFEPYKYLGIPIGCNGIHIPKYFAKIRKNFRSFTHMINHYCNSNHLNDYHRRLMYIATVRSQIQYAMATISYNEKEIDELEDIQKYALRKILRQSPHTAYATQLANKNLPYIRERADEAKINFFFKLINNNTKSLASKILKYLTRYPLIAEKDWMHRASPIRAMELALQRNGMKHCYNAKDQYPKQIAKQLVRNTMIEMRAHKIIRKLNQQHHKCHKEESYAPIEASHHTLSQHIQMYGGLRTKPDYSYIPHLIHDHQVYIDRAIVQCDNNPHWHNYVSCEHCNTVSTHHEIHKMLNCRNFNGQRTDILNSIITELDRYKEKATMILTEQPNNNIFKSTNIIQPEARELLRRLTEQSDIEVHPDNWNDVIHTLWGMNTTPTIQRDTKRNINQMLMAHFWLLILMQHHNPINQIDFTRIQYKNIDIQIATDDITAGKIIARQLIDGKIHFTNMRRIIEQVPMQ